MHKVLALLSIGSAYAIIIRSDHNNLRYFITIKSLIARQARWVEDLSAYDFTIYYLKGTKNPVDSLSRRLDFERDSLKRAGIELILLTLQHKLRVFNVGTLEPIIKVGGGTN